MSISPDDILTGYQGQNIFLDIKFYNGNTMDLVDPDAIPTYQIYDPLNNLVVSGNGNKILLGFWQAVYFISNTAPIGVWKIVWTATVGGYAVQNNVETFQVLDGAVKPQTQQVVIEDQWLRQIKKVLAFPGVDSILLNDDEIKEFAVWPAMFDYFSTHPVEQREQFAIGYGELVIPFPDNSTFGVTDVRIVGKFGESTQGVSFWDVVRFQTLYGGSLRYTGVGAYGSKYNFNGLKQSYLQNRQVANTYSRTYGTFKHYINYPDRQIECYSNSGATVNVTWARYSLDFKDVRFALLYEVIKIAQAYLLWHLADSSMLVDDQQLDKKFNSEAIKQRAGEIYDSVVTENWGRSNYILRN